MSCGVGCRRGSDPALLWPWRRLVAASPIRPPAWEPPYAAGAAQEIAKKKKEKQTWGSLGGWGEVGLMGILGVWGVQMVIFGWAMGSYYTAQGNVCD